MVSLRSAGMFKLSQASISHEDLFVERYDALVRMALQLTQRGHEEAVDLVQDAFVRFTLMRPDLTTIRNLDGYFYAMLRNMRLSRTRRAGQAGHATLSIVDWDSADIGLRAVDEHARVHARDDLRAACRYGCLRKDSSKSGGVFLLRFFHGYVPSEIARVLRTTPRIVDEWLRLARREAKVYLTEPQRLGFLSDSPKARDAGTQQALTSDLSPPEFLRSLQHEIFTHRHAQCFSAHDLTAWYKTDATEPLDIDVVAQIVCCPDCLGRIGQLLGFGEPSDRFPTDTLGPSARGPRRPTPADASRRTREVFEHRPQELRVAVNGFVVGVQRIAGEISDLTVTVGQPEPIGLVELFSEQGVCLAALDIEAPPGGPVEQAVQAELSDGRSVELAVSFVGPWPTVRALYRDPWLATEPRPAQESDATTRVGPESIAVARPRGEWLTRLRHLLLPQTWKARLALISLAIWLLFLTPGLRVSAAEQFVHLARRAAANLMELFKPTKEGPRPPLPTKPVSTLLPAAPVVASSSLARSAPKSPTIPPRLTTASAMALELNVLARLQRADAYLGQEITLNRASAKVHLQAVVRDMARRQALVAALGPLQADSWLVVDVRTVDDALNQRPQVAAPVAVEREFQFEKDRIPVYDRLREYYSRAVAPSGVASDARSVDDAIRRFASRMVDRSRIASQHAWALVHVVERYPRRTVLALDAEAREAWSTLIRTHATAFQREIAAVQQELRPIFTPAAPPEGDWSPREEARDDVPDLTQVAQDLIGLDRARDEAIRSAFAVSATGPGVSAVQADEFWQLLRNSQRAARAIEHAAATKRQPL